MGQLDVLDIPLFPLNAVLFPGGLLPLRVFEARYMDMARDCLKHEQPFGVCLIKSGKEVGAPAVPEDVGCLAHIKQWDMEQLGLLQLKAIGGLRFRIRSRGVGPQGLVRAQVDVLGIEPAAALPEKFAPCANLLKLVVADKSAAVFAEPHRFDDASWVGYRLSEILPIPVTAKQKLLELDDALVRLEILQRFLEQRGLLSGS